MSEYQYSPVANGWTRIIRLKPHKDKSARIECQLIDYDVSGSDDGFHMYEALSYVWGNPDMKRSISIEDHELSVTENLHAALLSLRNHRFERFLWIDAICMNQADDEEKERQIQYMGHIYSQANRVVVWLGEETESSKMAFESIRAITGREDVIKPSIPPERDFWSMYLKQDKDLEGDKKSVLDKSAHAAYLELLQRPWFRRIWVLQEVGMARNIVVKCGSTQMDGYAFCSGLNKVDLSFHDHPGLGSQIRSVTYLISGATFRSQTGPPNRLSLAELMNMYHTHEATKRHDMVYALLGLCCDDSNAAGLAPDYKMPWSELFKRLVKYLLSNQASVDTWDDRDMAVIRTRGYILGFVYVIKSHDSIQQVTVGTLYHKWTIRASAKPIKIGDIVVQMPGEPNIMITRAYKDHLDVITIYAKPLLEGENNSSLKDDKLCDLLLVWTWESSQAEVYGEEYPESSIRINDVMPGYLKTADQKKSALYNTALALSISKDYIEAEWRFKEAFSCYEKELGAAHPLTLNCLWGLMSIYVNQGFYTKNVLTSWDERTTAIASLRAGIRDNAKISGDALAWVAGNTGPKAMEFLFQLRGDGLPITLEVVEGAAGNLKHGPKVLQVLFDRCGRNLAVSESVVLAAAKNHYCGDKVMEILFDRIGDGLPITEAICLAATENFERGFEVMKILFDRTGDHLPITEAICMRVKNGHKVDDRLRDLFKVHTTSRMLE